MRHSRVGFGIVLYYNAVLRPKGPKNAAHSARSQENCQKDVTKFEEKELRIKIYAVIVSLLTPITIALVEKKGQGSGHAK